MTGLQDMARDLGRAMGRTEEYQALRRAISGMEDDRSLMELRTELEQLEAEMEATLRAGREPEGELAGRYESAVSRLQANSTYQRLVAAQANFDKIVSKVNALMSEGIREGGESRIILAT